LFTKPGGKPVTAVPGLTPRSPEITDGPVLVTVVPANTAKDVAVPSPTVGGAADADGAPTAMATITVAATAAVPDPITDPRRIRTDRNNRGADGFSSSTLQLFNGQ